MANSTSNDDVHVVAEWISKKSVFYRCSTCFKMEYDCMLYKKVPTQEHEPCLHGSEGDLSNRIIDRCGHCEQRKHHVVIHVTDDTERR